MITQADIDERNETIARLSPIAELVGLSFDGDDIHLLRALNLIATLRAKAGLSGSASASGGNAGSQMEIALGVVKHIESARAPAATTSDMGDLVAERVEAMLGVSRKTGT